MTRSNLAFLILEILFSYIRFGVFSLSNRGVFYTIVQVFLWLWITKVKRYKSKQSNIFSLIHIPQCKTNINPSKHISQSILLGDNCTDT